MSESRSIGSLIVKLVAQGVAAYKADVDGAAGATDKAARSGDKLQDVLKQQASAASLASAATRVLASAATFAASAFAAIKVVDLVRDSAMAAARFETLGVSMKMVGANAGYTSAQMDAAALGMQKMGISMVESRQQAMRLVQAHIDLADSQKLARIAQDAAVIGNMNSSEAYAALIHGISTGQTDVLRTIGLNVSMEQSYKAMAASLHKNADALTQNEKTQAILNAVMKEGQAIAGTYEAAMDTAGKQINSMKRYIDDFGVVAGGVFQETLTVAVMAFTNHLKIANSEVKTLAQNDTLKEWGNDIADVFAFAADAALSAIAIFQIAGKQLGYIAARTALFMSSNPQNKAELDRYNAAKKTIDDSYDADMDRLRNMTSTMRTALAQRRAAIAEHEAKLAQNSASNAAGFATAIDAWRTAYQKGEMSAKQYAKAVADMNQAVNGDNHRYADSAVAKATKASNKEFEAQAAILAKLSGYTADYEKTIQTYVAMRDKGTLSEEAFTRAVQELVAGQPGAVEATRELTAATAAQAKADEVAFKAALQNQDARDKSIKAMGDEAQKLEEENVAFYLNAKALAALTSSRLTDQAAMLETQAVKKLDRDLDYEAYDATMRLAAAIRAKAAATLAKPGIDATKDIADANKKAAEESSKYWEDALMRAFESGKGFFQSLWDTIKNTLKTQALKVLVTGVVGGVTGTANAMGGEGGGGGGIFGMVSGAKSTYDMFTGAGGYGGSFASLLNDGAQLVSGYAQQAGFTAFANSMQSVSGSILEYSSLIDGAAAGLGFLSALSSAADGNWGKAVGQAIGTAIFPGVGTLIGGFLGGLVDDLFGGGGGPKTEFGYGYGIGTGRIATLQGDSESPIAKYTKGVEDSWATWATKFGLAGSLNVGAFTSTDPQGDALTQVQVAAGLGGNSVYSRAARLGGEANIGNVGREQKDLEIALSNEATFVLFNALKSSDLDQQYLDYLNEVAAGLPMLKAEAEQVAAMNTAMSNISIVKDFQDALEGLPFEGLKNLSFDAAKGLIQAAGGLSALGSGLSGFYENFYTDAEKTTNLTRATSAAFANLGVTMPRVGDGTRAWYRSLVETAMAQDQSVAANAQYTASLLSLQGAVNTLAPAVSTLGDTLGDFADSVAKLVSGITEKVGSTIFDMQYGMEDNAGKYSMLDVRATRINDQMMTETDINKIASMAEDQIDLINKAWELLDPKQQKAQYLQFEDKLEKIDEFVQERGADAVSREEAHDKKFAETTANALKTALADAVAALQAAADKAEKPVEVKSSVSVTVTAPQGSEVSVV